MRSTAWLAWDGTDHEVLLWGGAYGPSYSGYSALNDSWYFNGRGWIPVLSAVSPPAVPPGGTYYSPAQWTSLVYDASDGYLLLTGTDIRNDSWAFAHGNWTQLKIGTAPTGLLAAYPSAPLVYDAADGYVLLVGVTYCGRQFCDADWAYHAGNWTRIPAPTTLKILWGFNLAYDPVTSSVISIGGDVIHAGRTHYTNETWSFRNGTWTNLPHAGGPAPSVADRAVYDPTLHGVILVADGVTRWSESWLFNHGRWIGLGPNSSTPGSSGSPFVFDVSSRSVEFFTGSQLDSFTNGSWSSRSAPTQRYSPWGAREVTEQPITYDPAVGAPVTVIRARGHVDLWAYGRGGWHEVARSHLTIRALGTLAYDASSGCLLTFGDEPGRLSNATWTYCNGTWSYHSWRHCAAFPQPTWGAALAYDAADGYLVMFGGVGYISPTSFTTADLNQTWKFVAGCWSPVASAQAPSPREAALLSYDSTDGELVLYGGAYALSAYGPLSLRADTWVYHAGVWTNVTKLSAGPSLRSLAAIADDPTNGDVILFGGLSASSHLLGDLWSFHAGVWKLLARTPAPSGPTSRDAQSMVYDPAAGGVFMDWGLAPSPYYPNPYGNTVAATGPWLYL